MVQHQGNISLSVWVTDGTAEKNKKIFQRPLSFGFQMDW